MSTDNIILIGFMGAGKTTVGRRLSARLGLPLFDTDERIEAKAGKRIRDIFAEEGEESFRRMETELLSELAADPGRYVIACGGGLPLREENRRLLKQLGTVFYLKASVETLYRRLGGDNARPLLKVSDQRREIERLLSEREDKYRCAADVVIDADHGKHAAVLTRILQVFENKA